VNFTPLVARASKSGSDLLMTGVMDGFLALRRSHRPGQNNVPKPA
jgi:hypothetical protein